MIGEPATMAAALDALQLPGGMLVLPTETLYGLSARASDVAAVERIAATKRREDRSFVAIAANLAMVQRYLPEDTPATTIAWLRQAWPAPLSVILRVNQQLAWGRLGVDSGPTAAFRIPAHPWLLELTAQLGEPILSTSVNRRGALPLQRASAIAAEFGAELDLLVEDPQLEAAAETKMASTLVDATHWPPRVIRAGAYEFNTDRSGHNGGWDG
jgi:L-threonylcarbamoyladenylate synthase